MIVIFIRTVLIFLMLMMVMRLMGKRQIGEMQAFELVITLIIADLACIPMADVSIPLIYGVVAILALFILHQVVSLFEKGGGVFKRVINGKPSVVINKNGVDFDELKKNNMDVEDLIEGLRTNGYFNLSEVKYAIFESSGKLSTLKNNEYDGVGQSISLLIVAGGKIVYKNLEYLSLSKEWLLGNLSSKGVNLKRVGVMTIDLDGLVYLQEEKRQFLTYNVCVKPRQKVKSEDA